MSSCVAKAARLYRPSVAAASVIVDSAADVPPWISLHEDIVGLLGWWVLAVDLVDYIRFRAVCKHWRYSTVCPRGRGIADARFHPRQWMLLPEGHRPQHERGRDNGATHFLNLSTGAYVSPRLPRLWENGVLASVEGLLLVHRRGGTTMKILHPFTGDVADLPPLTTLLTKWQADYKFREGYMFDNTTASLSVSADGVATVMIAGLKWCHIVYASTKDNHWRLSDWWYFTLHEYGRDISFQGKIYSLQLSIGGYKIIQLDPPRHEDREMEESKFSSFVPPKVIAICPSHKIFKPIQLVECDSEILLTGSRDCPYSTRMVVYRVADLMSGRVTPLTSIGGNALPVDIGRSFRAVSTISGDTIVCTCPATDDYIGQYHISGGT
ncbi:unnamed protein product [Alopecurus aequalis]